MTTDAHRSRPLRFGLHTALPRGTDFGDFAISVQEAGFDVMTIPDHLVGSLSPFAGATAAACSTSHLHVGTLVLNNDLRHPVDTAREAATIAAISGGRFELGLGAGPMKSEYDAAGLRFVLLSFILYAPATFLFVKARREQKRRLFSPAEAVICAVSIAGAVVGVIALAVGWIEL